MSSLYIKLSKLYVTVHMYMGIKRFPTKYMYFAVSLIQILNNVVGYDVAVPFFLLLNNFVKLIYQDFKNYST